MQRWLVTVVIVLFSALANAQGQAELHTLSHGGLERSYLLHLPADPDETPYPLVFVLHGRGGDAEGMAQLTEFNRVADAHGFAVVYPNGLEHQWNYIEGVPGYDLPADDVGFFRALAAELISSYPIDPERIYVAGFSNGGFMAQRLICAAGDLFAAYASVGAAGFGGMPLVCDNPHPASLLLMHGTLDRVVPFMGLSQDTPSGPVAILFPVVDTLAFWADYTGCDTQGRSFSLPEHGLSPGSDVKGLALEACPGEHELILYIVRGGGHNWPGQPDKLPEEIAGLVNQDIDAAEVIWEFFARHPKE